MSGVDPFDLTVTPDEAASMGSQIVVQGVREEDQSLPAFEVGTSGLAIGGADDDGGDRGGE